MAVHDFPASSGGVDISGTPSAGQYARWSDADTLEARSTSQVLADIGAPNISGTPVAGQVAVWSDADTLGGLRCWRAQLSHATYSNGELITLPFLASGGAADGVYFARIIRRATGGTTLTIGHITWTIASNALSGTPVMASMGTTVPPVTRLGVSGGAVVVHLNNTAAGEIFVEVFSSATAGGSFSISDASAVGTACTQTNAVSTLAASVAAIIGTDPGGSDPLRVGGGVTHSGAVTMSGSPASAGASVRNRHGAGGTTDIVDNVPTGGAHKRTINGVEYESLNADGTVTLHATTAASLASALGVSPIVKGSDETIQSDATVSMDTDLKKAILANTKYGFRIVAFFRTTDAADFKFSLLGPASPTLLRGRVMMCAANGTVLSYRPFGTYADLANWAVTGNGTGDNDGGYVIVEGVLHNGANAGDFGFGWSQNTSDASNTTVLAKSKMEVW